MRLFFAAGETGTYWAPTFDDVLVSFASPQVRSHPPTNKLWFLDSGAFSFFAQGRDGTDVLDEYIAYLKKIEHRRYAVMDVIGDTPGTWANDQKMRSAGLSPISAVHFGEPHTTMLQYLNAGIEDIALGGLASSTAGIEEASKWIEACFVHVREHWKRTGVFARVHGFGMMDEKLLLTFPFYSVDATSWLIGHRYGRVLTWDPKRVTLGQLNPRMEDEMSKGMRDWGVPLALLDGAVVPEARHYRAAWNICILLDLADFVTTVWQKRGVFWPDDADAVRSRADERSYLMLKYPEAIERRRTTWMPRAGATR